VPAGVGIAEQLLIALEKKQAVEQRDRGSYEGHIGHEPGRQNARIFGIALAGSGTDAIRVDTARSHHDWPHIYFEALLGGRSNAGQVARDALVQAHDTL